LGAQPVAVVRLDYDSVSNKEHRSPFALSTKYDRATKSHWDLHSAYSNFAVIRANTHDTFVAVSQGDYGAAGLKADQLEVIRPTDQGDTAHTMLPSLVGQILVGDLDKDYGIIKSNANPYQVSITPNNTVAYVTMRFGGGVAAVDLLTWKEIDTDRGTIGIDTIKFNNAPNAQPFDVVTSNLYAFVSEESDSGGHGLIYVIDIDPRSDNYNKHVLTLQVEDAGFGLRGLSLTPDNKQLLIAAPSVPHFQTQDSSTRGGKIVVIDISNIADLISKSAGLGASTLIGSKQVFAANNALQDPNAVQTLVGPGGTLYAAFVDTTQDAVGVVILVNTSGVWTEFNRIPLTLGPIDDSFDVNNGVDITFTEDLTYAFVYGRNDIADSISHDPNDPRSELSQPAGSNIGVIRDPFKMLHDGSFTGLVAATRMIPIAFGEDVTLSADNSILYGSYTGGISNTWTPGADKTLKGGVFAFSATRLITEVERWAKTGNPQDSIGQWPIDDLFYTDGNFAGPYVDLPPPGEWVKRTGLNTLIDLRADYENWGITDVPAALWGYRRSVPGDKGAFTDGLNHAPIITGGQTRGMAVQRKLDDINVVDSSGDKRDKIIFFAQGTRSVDGSVKDDSTQIITIGNYDFTPAKVVVELLPNQYLTYLGEFAVKPLEYTYVEGDFVALPAPLAYNDGQTYKLTLTLPAQSKIALVFKAVLSTDYIKTLTTEQVLLLRGEIRVGSENGVQTEINTYYLADLADGNPDDGYIALPDARQGATSTVTIQNRAGVGIALTAVESPDRPPFFSAEGSPDGVKTNVIGFNGNFTLPDNTTPAAYTAVIHFRIGGKDIGTALAYARETPVQTVNLDMNALRASLTEFRQRYATAASRPAAEREIILPGFAKYAAFAKAYPLTADRQIPDDKWNFTSLGIELLLKVAYKPFVDAGDIKFQVAGGADTYSIITNDFSPDPAAYDPPPSATHDFDSAEFLAQLTATDAGGNIVVRDDLTPASLLYRLDTVINKQRENEVNYRVGTLIRENSAPTSTIFRFVADFGQTAAHELGHNLGLFDEYLELKPKKPGKRGDTPDINIGTSGLMSSSIKLNGLETWFLAASLDDPAKMSELVTRKPDFVKTVNKLVQQVITLYKNGESNGLSNTDPGSLPTKVKQGNKVQVDLFASGQPDSDPFAPVAFDTVPVVPFGQKGLGLPPASFTLAEDPILGSRVSADVVMPTDSNQLRFILSDIDFASNGDGSPPDAFEFAIVGADGTPLSRITSLTDTDAALNIQADGTVATSGLISLNGLDTQSHAGHGPLIVTVNLSGIAAGTPIRLYFDLLGFGSADSKVTVSNLAFVTPGAHDGPVAVADRLTTDEDSVLTVSAQAGLLTNDLDLDEGGSFSLTAVNGSAVSVGQSIALASGALLRVNADGSFSYDPNGRFENLAPGATAKDSFTYTIADLQGLVSSATVTLTITGVNDAPTVGNVTQSTTLGTLVSGVLTATDVDSTSFTFQQVGTPLMGLTLSENGHWSYDTSGLASDATSVSFDYRASDGTALSSIATVTISLIEQNHAPVAGGATAQTNEDTVVASTLSATDADNDTLTYALVAPVAGVTVSADGKWSYDPRGRHDALAPGESDTVSFAFIASDGALVSEPATVTITVTGVDDAPVAKAAAAQTDEDTVVGGKLSATDVENDPLIYALVAPAAGVSLAADGTWSYDPRGRHDALAPGQSDTVSFAFTSSDGTKISNPASVTITITGINDAPVAVAVTVQTDEDTVFGGTLPATDAENDALTYALVAPVDGVTLAAEGTWSYDPRGRHDALAPGESDTVSFAFTASDGTKVSNPASVTITVTGINDAPIAIPKISQTDEDTVVGGALSATDVEGDALTYALVVPVAGVSVAADGTWSYDPRGRHEALAVGQSDTVSFAFTASDGKAVSQVATVTVTVAGVDDAPSITGPDSAKAKEGDLVQATFMRADVDQNDTVTLEMVSGPATASFDTHTGIFAWRAVDGPAEEAVVIRATDSQGQSSDHAYKISVSDVAPTLVLSGPAAAEVGANWTLTLGSSDPGNDPPLHWTVDWGDGKTDRIEGTANVAQHVFAEAGQFTVQASLTNDDRTFGPQSLTVAAQLPPLQVVDFTASASGFHVAFNHAFVPGDVSLYGAGPGDSWSDVRVSELFGFHVPGSLVVDGDGAGFTFIKTGGVLYPDVYTVRILSGASAFHDLNGGLDGDHDGTAGGNYVTQFAIGLPDGVVHMQDFVTSPGSVLRDSDGREGLRVTLGNLGGVRNIEFTIDYDPSMVQFDSVKAASELPRAATVQFQFADGVDGRKILQIKIDSPTPIRAGDADLVRLFGHAQRTYGGTEIIRIKVLSVNSEEVSSEEISSREVSVVGDDAIHIIANLNDVDDDTIASTAHDKTEIRSYREGRHSGFEAWRLIDPSLLITDDKPPFSDPFHPILEFSLPDWLFDIARNKLEPSIVGHNDGRSDFFEIAFPKGLRLDQILGSGRPRDSDGPTGSVDGDGKIRFCKATAQTFTWSFRVDLLLRLLGLSSGDLKPSQTGPVQPPPRSGDAPQTSPPGKSGEFGQADRRFAAVEQPTLNSEINGRRPAKAPRVVLETGLVEAAFFPAMFAAKSSVRGKTKGRPKAQRKPWEINFVGDEPNDFNPNREFSVRAAATGECDEKPVTR
jgi:VCBS repeat-containing protein